MNKIKYYISYFITRSLFCGFGLSILLNLTKQGIVISEILGLIIGYIILTIIKIYKNRFLELILNYIFIMIPCVVLVNLGHSLYLNDTSIFVLTIFTIISALLLSLIKYKNLNILSKILFIYSMILFFLKFLLLRNHIILENFLPISNINIINIIVSAIIFALTSITPLICLINDDLKEIRKMYVVSLITIIVLSFLIVSVMGVKEALIYRYPEYIVLKRIKLLNFITNVDNIFAFQIICDLFITMSLALKNIRKLVKSKKTIIVFIISSVTILSSLIVFNSDSLLFIYEYFPLFLVFIFIMIIFPKKNKYNNNNS